MQAYCVSKRPPRALFLALAIALGVVAVSAAVLPSLSGGLMRDGTYLRLLGYRPSNSGATLTALGAPDVQHFVALQTSDDGCSWTREITATDANHDGHPEYVHVRMLGTCILDEDHDGAAEAGLTIARDFQVWDNDSNGKFNALEGRQGVEAFADPNENGVHEYTARALWTVSIKDANEDQKPESLMATSDRKS